jgi:hypothetical protein
MNKDQIIENNKVIMKYMGIEPKFILGKYRWDDLPYFVTSNESKRKTINSVAEYVKYHKSWDWLMPVVEKIEEDFEDLDIDILCHGTRIYVWRTDEELVNNIAKLSFSNKIEHTYDAVVKFLKLQKQ